MRGATRSRSVVGVGGSRQDRWVGSGSKSGVSKGVLGTGGKGEGVTFSSTLSVLPKPFLSVK